MHTKNFDKKYPHMQTLIQELFICCLFRNYSGKRAFQMGKGGAYDEQPVLPRKH